MCAFWGEACAQLFAVMIVFFLGFFLFLALLLPMHKRVFYIHEPLRQNVAGLFSHVTILLLYCGFYNIVFICSLEMSRRGDEV